MKFKLLVNVNKRILCQRMYKILQNVSETVLCKCGSSSGLRVLYERISDSSQRMSVAVNIVKFGRENLSKLDQGFLY